MNTQNLSVRTRNVYQQAQNLSQQERLALIAALQEDQAHNATPELGKQMLTELPSVPVIADGRVRLERVAGHDALVCTISANGQLLETVFSEGAFKMDIQSQREYAEIIGCRFATHEENCAHRNFMSDIYDGLLDEAERKVLRIYNRASQVRDDTSFIGEHDYWIDPSLHYWYHREEKYWDVGALFVRIHERPVTTQLSTEMEVPVAEQTAAAPQMQAPAQTIHLGSSEISRPTRFIFRSDCSVEMFGGGVNSAENEDTGVTIHRPLDTINLEQSTQEQADVPRPQQQLVTEVEFGRHYEYVRVRLSIFGSSQWYKLKSKLHFDYCGEDSAIRGILLIEPLPGLDRVAALIEVSVDRLRSEILQALEIQRQEGALSPHVNEIRWQSSQQRVEVSHPQQLISDVEVGGHLEYVKVTLSAGALGKTITLNSELRPDYCGDIGTFRGVLYIKWVPELDQVAARVGFSGDRIRSEILKALEIKRQAGDLDRIGIVHEIDWQG